MDEPSGKTFGASGSKQETNDDLDLGKPWDFLGVDWARNQVVKIKNIIRALEADLDGTDRAVATHNDRISALESKVDWIQTSGGEAQVEMERRISELEAALTSYGVPFGARPWIGNRHVASKTEHFANLYGMSPIGRDDPSWPTKEHDDAVREAVLNEAAERVRDYMKGHWSEASIGGVVQALRGEDDSRTITDHAFRYSSPDRRHCSYRKNHRGPRCDMLKSDHTYAQAQPDGPIRPV